MEGGEAMHLGGRHSSDPSEECASKSMAYGSGYHRHQEQVWTRPQSDPDNLPPTWEDQK